MMMMIIIIIIINSVRDHSVARCILSDASEKWQWRSCLYVLPSSEAKCHTVLYCTVQMVMSGVLTSEGWREAWQPSRKVTRSL